MQKLSVSEKFPLPSTSTTPKQPAPVAAAARPAPRQPMVAHHPKSDVSNSSAASDWLRSAQQEASKSTTHAAVVVGIHCPNIFISFDTVVIVLTFGLR